MIYIIILICSFLLDGLFTLVIPIFSSHVLPLFVVVSLTLIYPYLRKRDFLFEKYAIVVGLSYDLIYTNTICMYAIIFYLLSYVLAVCYRYSNINFFSQLLIVGLIIIIYRISIFLLLVLINYLPFDLLLLLEIISKSLIGNLIYAVVLYLLLKLLRGKERFIKYH